MLSDLNRNSWCILGLLFDKIDTAGTIDYLTKSAQENHTKVVCTPNINHIILAIEDQGFRDSSLNCNLSIADGMPIVWIARFLEIPILSRVPGSGLILDLCTQKQGSKLSLFLFGGEDGVAKLAAERVNQMQGRMTACGFLSPGHGSVIDMSTAETILEINKHHPDLLLVALGAKKGQAWIDHNKNTLNAKVISHLGATINFLAGSVKRAPTWMQKYGLEWLWRIIEEPSLWARYFRDGLQLSRLVFTRVIPYWWFLRRYQSQQQAIKTTHVKLIPDNNKLIIKVSGTITQNKLGEIRPQFKDAILDKKDLGIDLSNVNYLDSAFLAFLILVRKQVIQNGYIFNIEKSNSVVDKVIYYNCMEFIVG